MVAERRNAIPILLRTKAKNLYVNQSLTTREVATHCGLTPEQVANLSKRYGWSSGRQAIRKRLTEVTQEKIEATADELSNAIVSECEEIALASLANARSALTDTHKDAPKNFQAWTAGARNLVSIRQALRNGGTDTLDSSGGKDTRNVAVFFMSGETKRAEKRVQSSVDASGV